MSKIRSDSVFCQLKPEQLETLEGWLFEERTGYKQIVERVQKEFGLTVSQSAVSRLYKHLSVERSRESLEEAMSVCMDTAAVMKTPGILQEGLLTLANKCAIEFVIQKPDNIDDLIRLLRALTSAQGQHMKRMEAQREEESSRRRAVEQKPAEAGA